MIIVVKTAAAPVQVEMVVVGDDCALPHSRITGRRGIAGTVFVHKARPLMIFLLFTQDTATPCAGLLGAL